MLRRFEPPLAIVSHDRGHRATDRFALDGDKGNAAVLDEIDQIGLDFAGGADQYPVEPLIIEKSCQRMTYGRGLIQREHRESRLPFPRIARNSPDELTEAPGIPAPARFGKSGQNQRDS